jgi:hypothetical protein
MMVVASVIVVVAVFLMTGAELAPARSLGASMVVGHVLLVSMVVGRPAERRSARLRPVVAASATVVNYALAGGWLLAVAFAPMSELSFVLGAALVTSVAGCFASSILAAAARE